MATPPKEFSQFKEKQKHICSPDKFDSSLQNFARFYLDRRQSDDLQTSQELLSSTGRSLVWGVGGGDEMCTLSDTFHGFQPVYGWFSPSPLCLVCAAVGRRRLCS